MDVALGECREEIDQVDPVGVTAEALAAAYLTRVHRFAVMVCPSGADPEELAQQAMLKALERADTFDPRRGTLDAWLWSIVANVARDAGRLARRRDFLLQRIVLQEGVRFAGASAEDLALERIRDQDLVAAVRALPLRYRTLIALRYGAGLRSVEIARLLGTTRMAVLKSTRRALDRLQIGLSKKRVT
jgi:RNA polymerase sigma-70 factor (ECF subfamily)